MSTLIYNYKYRPIRIGWCIREGDKETLIKAFRLSHCLWGGRFNPIIVIDNEPFARHMVETFQVDALFPFSTDERCVAFAKKFKNLPWPDYDEKDFEQHSEVSDSVFLNIYHPVRWFWEEFVKNKREPTRHSTLYQWSDKDSFAGMFEAMLGNYPIPTNVSHGYHQFVKKYTGSEEKQIALDGMLDASVIHAITPSLLTTLELNSEFGAGSQKAGLFVGEADSFSHLVEFWNLRAAGIELLFFDPRYAERFSSVVQKLEESVRSQPPHPEWGAEPLELWLKSKLGESEIKRFTVPLGLHDVKESTWDDRIWKGLKVTPSVMYLTEGETVGQISEGTSEPIVTLQLANKPGFDEPRYRSQNLVVTLKSTLNLLLDDSFIFSAPNIPELNEYFGRKHHLSWNEARAVKEGFSVITHLGSDHLTLWGMERFAFAKKLFETFGIGIKLSQPGLVCEQLVRQMGGIQGCRVLKIKGVRKLIEAFEPTQSFDRTAAMDLIRNVDRISGKWDFSPYENLHIERRDANRLKPDDVFTFLLKRGVFRVGLQLKCTSCGLEFWKMLDDVKSLVTCEYCGREFNTTPQLKDRNWAYRPSGLFGRGDNQEGGVPVALTLQQLETSLRSELVFWLPATNLEPITANIDKCEADFILLCQDHHGRVKLVIGECKTNNEITDQDIRNLSKIAAAFPPERFDVFTVFSKTGTFSADEIERFKTLDSKVKEKIILLSEDELEPYFLYSRATEKYVMRGRSGSLEGMVEATHNIYFDPQLKPNPLQASK